MPRAQIHVNPTTAPDEVSGLAQRVEDGTLDPKHLVAIPGKTEGNGCVNDFTRAFSVSALKAFLGEVGDGVIMVMSGGTERGLSLHLVSSPFKC
ncbi:MAG: ring-opening amidohydrolase [Pseudomonadota bacterium]